MNNFNMIVTCDQNNIITLNNKNPWDINDNLIKILHSIKKNIVIIGRKTFENLSKKYLKKSITIVLSSSSKLYIDKSYLYKNTFIVNCKQAVFDLLSNFYIYSGYGLINNNNNNYNNNIFHYYKVFIIGGQEIYKLFIENTRNIYIIQIISDIIIKNDDLNNDLDKKIYICNGEEYETNITKFDVDMSQFELIKESELFLTENNGILYEYLIYSRINI
jgi:dihydrofolate reductase